MCKINSNLVYSAASQAQHHQTTERLFQRQGKARDWGRDETSMHDSRALHRSNPPSQRPLEPLRRRRALAADLAVRVAPPRARLGAQLVEALLALLRVLDD